MLLRCRKRPLVLPVALLGSICQGVGIVSAWLVTYIRELHVAQWDKTSIANKRGRRLLKPGDLRYSDR